MDVVRDIWSGKQRFADVVHPDLAIIQDIAVQAKAASRIARPSGWAVPTPASSCGAKF
jgi:hypothetical protein